MFISFRITAIGLAAAFLVGSGAFTPSFADSCWGSTCYPSPPRARDHRDVAPKTKAHRQGSVRVMNTEGSRVMDIVGSVRVMNIVGSVRVMDIKGSVQPTPVQPALLPVW